MFRPTIVQLLEPIWLKLDTLPGFLNIKHTMHQSIHKLYLSNQMNTNECFAQISFITVRQSNFTGKRTSLDSIIICFLFLGTCTKSNVLFKPKYQNNYNNIIRVYNMCIKNDLKEKKIMQNHFLLYNVKLYLIHRNIPNCWIAQNTKN